MNYVAKDNTEVVNGKLIYVAKDEADIAAYAARLNLADDEAEIVAYGDGQAWRALDENEEDLVTYGRSMYEIDDELEIEVYGSGQLWVNNLENVVFYAERFSGYPDETERVLEFVCGSGYYKNRIKHAKNLEEEIYIWCEASCELSEYEEAV